MLLKLKNVRIAFPAIFEAKTFAQLIYKFQLIQTNVVVVVVAQIRKNREKLESCFFHPIKWNYSLQGRN